MEEIQLTIPRKVSYLYLATTLSKQVCQQIKECRDKKKFASDIELCVSEACTNAIKYARSVDKDDVISIYFQIYSNKIIIKVQDRGSGFNLDDLPDPDIERIPERGYGLYIIRSKVDKVQYSRTERGNFLTMIKYFMEKKKVMNGGTG